MTVTAAKFDDALLLGGESAIAVEEHQQAVHRTDLVQGQGDASTGQAAIPTAGVYQVDLVVASSGLDEAIKKQLNGFAEISFGDRVFSSQLKLVASSNEAEQRMAFLLTELPAGELKVSVKTPAGVQPLRVDFIACDESGPAAARFRTFQRRVPQVGVHLGLRRDCGSTMRPVGVPQAVTSHELQTYVL